MAITTYTGIPSQIEAGSTTIFTETFAEFPTADWAARLIIVRPGDNPVRVDATESGGIYTFTLPTTATESMPAGWYDYAIYVSNSTQRATAKTGRLLVLDNLEVKPAASFAEEMVATLEGALKVLAATTESSASFNGQTYTQGSIGEYQRQLTYFRAEVIRERAKRDGLRGTGDSGFVSIEFGGAQSVSNTYPWVNR